MTPDELRRCNFVTVQQTAEIFDVDERTIRRGIEQGQIPAVKVGTKTLIPAPRLAALIDPPAAPTPGALVTAVDTAGPSAIAAATEILRGALRALEALTAPGNPEDPPAPDLPARAMVSAASVTPEHRS